ncbi:hypothetical protein [Phaffia rhodozyma]|uniref:Uncharacterized protein n=1 Tax=Phaffia rhodozyma TaxID=264483 RepID=A0A0F7SL52_PHARH|nr:hypothetical protein [Phaffia rhodozyma]
MLPFRSVIARGLPTIGKPAVHSRCSTSVSAVLPRRYHSQTSSLCLGRNPENGSPLQMTIDALRRAGWSLADIPAREHRMSASKQFNVPNDFRYQDHARRRKLLDVFVDKSEEVVVESIRTNQHAVRVHLSVSFAAVQKLVSMDKMSSIIETSFFKDVFEAESDESSLERIPA